MKSSPNTVSVALQEQVGKITGELLGQYLALTPEKRQELEAQGATLSTMFSNQFAQFINHARIGSVLIIMEEGIGNMVMLTPAIRNLKESHPSLKITVLCKPAAAQVIRGWDAVDKVITDFDDCYYDLCFKTIWSQGVSQQLGDRLQHYCKSTISAQFQLSHEAIQHMAVNNFLESYSDVTPTHCEIAKGEKLEELHELMVKENLISAQSSKDNTLSTQIDFNKYIVFGDTALRLPGGGWDNKRWPHYAELAELIRRKFPDYKIVVIGDAEDLDEQQKLTWPENTTLAFCGAIDIPQLAYLIKHSTIYIGNDTGPTHIAAAVGAKTYAIFAPTMVAKNYPIGNNVTILNKRMPCSPCQYTDKFSNCECISYHTATEIYNEIFFPDPNKKRKVMVVGDFSTGGSLGSFRNENYIRKTIEREYSCKVIQHDYRATLKKEGNQVAATQKLVNDILHHEPEFVLICGGQKVHPQVLNIVNQITPGIKMACWYVDNRGQVESWFYNLSSICHASFWSTGMPELVSAVFAQTQKPCEFLPITPDSESFKPVEAVEKDIDVLFVGTPHSKERIELLEYLADNLPKEVNFKIYGNGEWPQKLKKYANPGVFDKDFNNVLNRSRIVINQNIINQVPLYFSDRYFFPMATKTVGLNKYVPKLEDMFNDGEHMVFWNTPEEALMKINDLLASPKKLAYISKKGYELYKEKYTLAHMIQNMFISVNVDFKRKEK